MELANVLFAIAGAGILLAAVLPRALSGRPFSLPLVFLLVGFVVYQFPLGLPHPDPVAYRGVAEHLSELVIIIALMGAGLAIDRPVGLRSWGRTWRLLGVAMPLSIAAIAATAGLALGWPLAAAALIGAALAPTDPVLASDVQVGKPSQARNDDEVRVALTSEAGLNDGLAFPFVYAAIALATTSGASWLLDWVLVDLLYRIAVGVLVGWVIGRLLARLFFPARAPSRVRLSEYADGFAALAATFLAYGITELVSGYGFIAVFVTAITIRAAERTHGYHVTLHRFIEQVERLLIAWVLLLFGGAIAIGILEPLTWTGAIVGVVALLIVRPGAAMLAQLGKPPGIREKGAVAFFGIRGIGSIFYLAYALGHGGFGVPAEQLWAVLSFVVLASVLLHGITATPAMNYIDSTRRERLRRRGITRPSADDLAAEHV